MARIGGEGADVSTMNMVFCDGLVDAIPYAVGLKVHHALANRQDGPTPNFDF